MRTLDKKQPERGFNKGKNYVVYDLGDSVDFVVARFGRWCWRQLDSSVVGCGAGVIRHSGSQWPQSGMRRLASRRGGANLTRPKIFTGLFTGGNLK
jgi:hypothetical protein